MKKTGFTLAEVLITLGIIGVVAALTAPALVSNTGQAKIGPTLAKFVNTFETATQQLFYEEEISKLSNADGVSSSFGAYLGESLMKYIPMTRLDSSDLQRASHPLANKVMGKGMSFVIKDGSIFFIYEGNKSSYEKVTIPEKSAYKGLKVDVYYDINGLKKPNLPGKDMFQFVLDDSGILIPFGSNAWNKLNRINPLNCDVNASEENARYACTGKIADNNWKADY